MPLPQSAPYKGGMTIISYCFSFSYPQSPSIVISSFQPALAVMLIRGFHCPDISTRHFVNQPSQRFSNGLSRNVASGEIDITILCLTATGSYRICTCFPGQYLSIIKVSLYLVKHDTIRRRYSTIYTALYCVSNRYRIGLPANIPLISCTNAA